MKTRTAIIVFAIISFAACTRKNEVNRKVIDDHFKYMNEHNLPAIKSQYADSAFLDSYIMPGYKRGPLGADEIYHFQFFQSPNEQYRVVDMIDNDTTTIVQYDVRGYLSTSIVRSGYSFRNCSIFKIRDGKIVSEITYTGKTPADVSH